jgi:hypothetical protein
VEHGGQEPTRPRLTSDNIIYYLRLNAHENHLRS